MHTGNAALEKPISTLSGVGPERAAQLAKLGIHTVQHLLLHRPRRYEDRRAFVSTGSLLPGAFALCRGTVVAKDLKVFRSRRRSAFELFLDDGTGRIRCRWWNVPYMEKYFESGDEVVVYGKILSGVPPTMDHPETEVVTGREETFIHLNRITPIYPITEGLSQRWLRARVFNSLEEFVPKAGAVANSENWAALDEGARLLGYVSHYQAIRQLHFPQELTEAEAARARLALEEMLLLQTQLLLRRRNFQMKAGSVVCAGDNRLIKPFLTNLHFRLTSSQTAVLRELRRDMAGRYPMRRLLQGDVGSGKTVVAACAALMAMEAGYDVALMAPTELLSEQHFSVMTRWLQPLGLGVEIRTGSRTQKLGGSGPCLHIGTHALLHAGFTPENLGLVIIDEQHRFGVAQREDLVRKGKYPHLLVMTATPIPRTLGLTLYGDLDISVILEKPPGRGRLKTYLRTPERLSKVWEFIRQQLADNRQAYVIYPRVEDGPEKSLKSVKQQVSIVSRALAPFTVALMHGRMRAEEKETVMAGFRKNEVQVLVATSLIEVGVDVPNATVMLIENAEAFGLAQLHQLRGRIGRGAQDAHCILVAPAETLIQQRLKILVETTDGFAIADHDLKLRGPGEFLGKEQSGLPDFRFFDFSRDAELVPHGKALALLMLPKRD